jgi:2-pyrone-4,6-dicarboxylate lactonase
MVDALVHSGGKARGVATVRRSISDTELQALNDAGVRGVRFNFVKRLVDFTPKDELLEIAGRIAKLGWHVVIYFEAVDLPEPWDFFTAAHDQCATPVVVDHKGRPDVSLTVDGPQFALFERFMREHGNDWSKVSCPERLSVAGPRALDGEQNACRDVVPFARRIVETFPDRVLWGTDWPHPNLKDHMGSFTCLDMDQVVAKERLHDAQAEWKGCAWRSVCHWPARGAMQLKWMQP